MLSGDVAQLLERDALELSLSAVLAQSPLDTDFRIIMFLSPKK